MSVSSLHDFAPLKAQVEARTGVTANTQRLVFAGKDLDDEAMNFVEEWTMHTLLSLMGGVKHKNIGADDGDKEMVLGNGETKKLINTKMIETTVRRSMRSEWNPSALLTRPNRIRGKLSGRS